MSVCKKCGSELPEGSKFCVNCGATVEEVVVDAGRTIEAKEKDGSILDTFGRFFGIILLILCFVNIEIDSPILTILLSIAIIAGCIFCLGKKYKLKAFTIIALIISVITLLTGISSFKYDIERKKNEKNSAGSYSVETEVADSVKTSVEEPATSVSSSVKENLDDEDLDLDEDDLDWDEDEDDEEDWDDEDWDDEDEDTDGDISDDKSATEADGVDPDLKEFLDSYEEYMNEYVEFMNKYAKSNNTLGMLKEYTEMSLKYQKFLDTLDKYDESEMSNEDLKYYMEVMHRVNMKLLEIGED